jgi:hypothetical protein
MNELINTTFGCCPSSKAADVVPKGATSAGTHAQHTTACHMHLAGALEML